MMNPNRGTARSIVVRNARANNLKDINVTFEAGRLYALAGPSGSGKTSLAFDVLYAEANRLGNAWGLVRVYRPEHSTADVSGLPGRTIGIQQQVLHRFTTESVGHYTGLIHRILQRRSDWTQARSCERCHGRGYVKDVDESRIVRDPCRPPTQGALTPAVKALAGLDSRKWQQYCRAENIDPDMAWADLPRRVRDAILFGGRGFVSIVEAIREAVAGRMPRLPKAIARELEQELQSLLSRVRCRCCGGLGYGGLDEPIDLDAGLEEVVRRGLLPLSVQELGWLSRLSLTQINLLSPVHQLSSYQARALRLMAGICGATCPTLVLFDEPIAGLLPREGAVMAAVLRDLADAGHTVIVAEHGEELVKAADVVVAFGPGAGEMGGQIVFEGSPSEYLATHAVDSAWVDVDAALPGLNELESSSSRRAIRRRTSPTHRLQVSFGCWSGMAISELEIPLGKLVCVSGPAGSGKTAVLEAVFASTSKASGAWQGRVEMTARKGYESIRRPHIITPEGIGIHAGSTPATYVGVWDRLRDLYATLGDARRLKLTPSHFSFNAAEGRCPTCSGRGFQDRDDGSYGPCPTCRGGRLCARVAQVKWQGVSLPEINSYTVHKAAQLFADQPSINRYLGFLDAVALDYLVLGQASWALSGGEAQRIKIATQLCKKLGDRSMYILDEPFRGVGQTTCPRLMRSLRHLVSKNNTVLIAANEPEVARRADWLIMLDLPRGLPKPSLNIAWQGEGHRCPATYWQTNHRG